MSLREAWNAQVEPWVRWARSPQDSYWRFHRVAFLRLLPAPGALTLDVGCGEGRVSRDLRALGHTVVGVDASAGMVAASYELAPGQALVADAARLAIRDRVADCAVAFMSLHDIDDLELAVGEIGRCLRPGGALVGAVVHPLNSAGTFVGPSGDPDRPFVITGSWFERMRYTDVEERDGMAMTFSSEHRPLQDYAEALADAGFVVERLREVRDPDPTSAWHRMPLFLDFRARRL